MKNRIIRMALILTLVLTFVGLGVFAAQVTAAEPTDLTIKGANLTLGDTVYMSFVVPESEGLTLLVHKGTPDAEAIVLSPVDTMSVGGVPHSLFTFPIAAKEMAMNVYAEAKVDENVGPMLKYSVLQYVRNKKSSASTTEKLANVLDRLLSYGAAAQIYFDADIDRLADSAFYEIKTVDGALPDGMQRGLYLEGDVVMLTAESVNAEGEYFYYWLKDGALVSEYESLEITVGTVDETYTAVYGDELYSKGLEYYYYDFSDSYNVIGRNGCDGDVVIPSTFLGTTVTQLSAGVFSYCDDITSVTIPETVTDIAYDAFILCENLESINVAEGNPVYSSVDGNLLSKDKTELLCVPVAKAVGTYEIPDGVETIGLNAFAETPITGVVIPDSVTTIGENAFYYCYNLESVTVPANVETIGVGAFSYCEALTSVTLSEGLETIGDAAFEMCTKLTSITIPDTVTSFGYSAFLSSGLTSLTIPEGVTVIHEELLSGCADLESVTLPNSIQNIERFVFANCESLSEIIFEGTVAEWNAITKSAYWNESMGEYTITCTDGSIA